MIRSGNKVSGGVLSERERLLADLARTRYISTILPILYFYL